MKKFFLTIASLLFFVVGIIGMILPIIQGLPFIILGTIILTIIFPELEIIVEKKVDRLGRHSKYYYKIKKFLHSKIKI